MNHYTCLVVGALCMFKWLSCFALLHRKSGNACSNHFFLQKNNGHALPCGSSSTVVGNLATHFRRRVGQPASGSTSHALNYTVVECPTAR